MNIRESDFWKALKKLMRTDDHVAVPDTCVKQALDIFQVQQPNIASVFRLRPAFLGAVRRTGGAAKKLYELGDRVVQLELTQIAGGCLLSGFAHGFDDIPVTLHGQEVVFQTTIDAGAFSFETLPEGKYTMSFSQDGEDYWITGLDLVNTE